MRRFLAVSAAILIIVFFLLVIPSVWSLMNPDEPPLGYFPGPLVYLAGLTGVDKLVDPNPAVPDGIKQIRNVEYKNVGGKSLSLCLYIPEKLSGPAPLLVFIHGGGWRTGRRSDYFLYLIDFAKRGYATASVTYRLIADSLYPASVEDVGDAVKWLTANAGKYGYDPDRIALIGGSAGGHLAMLTGYGWHKPGSAADEDITHHIKAVVDIYGPYDLTTRYARNNRLVTTYLGHNYRQAPKLFLESSPKNYVRPGIPPTLIFQGTADMLVPVSQSDSLAARLEQLHIPYQYYRLPGWPHVMDKVARVNTYVQTKMDLFLKKYLN